MNLVRENINFERGLDPKEAMGIGKEALDKKAIEETEWYLPLEIIRANFIIISIIRDYMGYPILMVKSKSDGDGDGKRYVAVTTDYRTDYYDDPKLAMGEIKGYINTRVNSNESQNFERGQDPKVSMGIGQRVKIEEWLKEMHIENYKIKKDFTIDIGSPQLGDTVALDGFQLTELPPYIQFGIVYGGFNISKNQLTSLRGCPYEVQETEHYKGNFKCFSNELKTLEFAPKVVDGAFICYDNPGKFRRIDVESVCKVTGKQIWGDDDKKVNEGMNFERGIDPFDAMDIGTIVLIKEWMAKTGLKEDEYRINLDGTIDTLQDINIVGMQLTELPPWINFNIAYANFYAAHNHFTSLEGFPKEVKGDFSIYSEHQKDKLWKEDYIRERIKIDGTIWN